MREPKVQEKEPVRVLVSGSVASIHGHLLVLPLMMRAANVAECSHSVGDRERIGEISERARF